MKNESNDTIECPHCLGFGDVATDEGTFVCATCSGSGVVGHIVTAPLPAMSETPRTDAYYRGKTHQNLRTAEFAEMLEKEGVAKDALIAELREALKWTLSKEPSPCRCLDFATPPHVCIAHKALAKLPPMNGEPH